MKSTSEVFQAPDILTLDFFSRGWGQFLGGDSRCFDSGFSDLWVLLYEGCLCRLGFGHQRGGVRSVLQLPKGIDMSVPCTGFTTISTTYMSKQTQRINDISAAYVVVSFVSSEFMKRRLLK